MVDSPQVVGSILVTPDDANNLPSGELYRSILVGVEGAIKVTYVNGIVDTIPTLAAGVWHPMRVKRIWSIGTTATGIHAGY